MVGRPALHNQRLQAISGTISYKAFEIKMKYLMALKINVILKPSEIQYFLNVHVNECVCQFTDINFTFSFENRYLPTPLFLPKNLTIFQGCARAEKHRIHCVTKDS